QTNTESVAWQQRRPPKHQPLEHRDHGNTKKDRQRTNAGSTGITGNTKKNSSPCSLCSQWLNYQPQSTIVLSFQFPAERIPMHFEYSDKVQALRKRLIEFMDEYIYPNEQTFYKQIEEGDRWQPTAIIEELKPKARAVGLWNLFLPENPYGE